MLHAWFDVTAGVSGDMVLGSLLDAGADPAAVQQALELVAPGSVRLETELVDRAGQRATKVHVRVLVDDPPHRSWRTIRRTLEDAPLADQTRAWALAAFTALADAEAATHGIAAEDVHFHEVGALDSIADVVGACEALRTLGVSAVSASPVALGSGRVRAAHGDLPVPVPAVARLVVGWRTVALAAAAPEHPYPHSHPHSKPHTHPHSEPHSHPHAHAHAPADLPDLLRESVSSRVSQADVVAASGREPVERQPQPDERAAGDPATQPASVTSDVSQADVVAASGRERVGNGMAWGSDRPAGPPAVVDPEPEAPRSSAGDDHPSEPHDRPARLLTPGELGELATPTGLAVVRALATRCEALPAMTVRAVGVGAGGRDTPGRPNVVRVVVGEPVPQPEAPRPSAADRPEADLLELMANVDDLDPRLWPGVLDAVLDAGAVDAWLVPIQMKKGRPAFTLHALVAPGRRDAVADAVLTHTTTLGVREVGVHRTVLDRHWVDVDVAGRSVPIKIGSRSGRILHAAAEFDALAGAASAAGLSQADVAQRASAAIVAAGLSTGGRVPPGARPTAG